MKVSLCLFFLRGVSQCMCVSLHLHLCVGCLTERDSQSDSVLVYFSVEVMTPWKTYSPYLMLTHGTARTQRGFHLGYTLIPLRTHISSTPFRRDTVASAAASSRGGEKGK